VVLMINDKAGIPLFPHLDGLSVFIFGN
jgi:hypothetical protein